MHTCTTIVDYVVTLHDTLHDMTHELQKQSYFHIQIVCFNNKNMSSFNQMKQTIIT